MKRDFRPSALHPLPTPLLSILTASSFAHGSPHEPLEPVRQHRPENEERAQEKSQRNQRITRLGRRSHSVNKAQNHIHDKQSDYYPNEELRCSPQEGHLRLRGGKFPAAALRADLGETWVLM